MPFGRRNKKGLSSYLRSVVLFLFSFSRIKKYISLSIKRLRGSPYELAIGFSTGIAISFTPFIGLHTLISIAIAWMLRGSMAAAIIGTLFGNPWTFPFIWYLSLEIGSIFYGDMLNLDGKISFIALKNELTTLILIFKNLFITIDLQEISNNVRSLNLIPVMGIGSIPLVVLSWLLSYFLFINVFKSYQNRLLKKRKNATRS